MKHRFNTCKRFLDESVSNRMNIASLYQLNLNTLVKIDERLK